jgi:hypothetical protein
MGMQQPPPLQMLPAQQGSPGEPHPPPESTETLTSLPELTSTGLPPPESGLPPLPPGESLFAWLLHPIAQTTDSTATIVSVILCMTIRLPSKRRIPVAPGRCRLRRELSSMDGVALLDASVFRLGPTAHVHGRQASTSSTKLLSS